MPDSSEALRLARAQVASAARRAIRLYVLGAFLLAPIIIGAVVGAPFPWWLAATAALSLAVQGYALMKFRAVLAMVDAAAVRGWMTPAGYAMVVAGAAGLMWALWQLATLLRAA